LLNDEDYFVVAHSLPNHKWGRTIPVDYLSLSVFHRPTRHALCEGTYRDIDLKNAQPQITNAICLQNNIINDKLIEYVKDPKKYRQKIMEQHGCDKDTAKNLPIMLMFGGSYAGWIKEHNITVNDECRMPMFSAIECEMAKVMEIVYKSNPDIVKDVKKQNKKKWKDQNEEKRGCMALWAQTIERRMMEDAVSFLVDDKNFTLEDMVPCQDGLMIKTDLWYDEILYDITKVINDKYHFNLVWEEKPFDEAIDIPECHDCMIQKAHWEQLLANKSLAQRLVHEKRDNIIKNNGSVYVYHNCRWYNDTLDKYMMMRRLISEYLFYSIEGEISSSFSLSQSDKTLLKKLARDHTSDDNRIHSITNHVISVLEPHFDMFDVNPFLLGFENGVMELKTKTFRPFKYDDYITLTTGYNYEHPDYCSFEFCRKRFFLLKMVEQIMPDEVKLLKNGHEFRTSNNRRLLYQFLCSCLDGINYSKFWFLNGRGRNGKGTLQKLQKRILGPKFFASPNESVLKSMQTSGPSCDIADLENKRYIVFPEMSGKIRLALLRKLTGGDEFTARQNHSNNRVFNLIATLAMEFNNFPEFDVKLEVSDYQRILNKYFASCFIDKNNDVDQKIGKTIDGITYRQADKKLAQKEFANTYCMAWLDIILDQYVRNFSASSNEIEFQITDSVKNATKSSLDSVHIFAQVFYESYKENKDAEDDNEENRLPIGTIWQTIQISEAWKAQSATQKATTYGRKSLTKWCKEKFTVKQCSSSKKDYILGFRRIDDNDDDTSSIDSDENDGETTIVTETTEVNAFNQENTPAKASLHVPAMKIVPRKKV